MRVLPDIRPNERRGVFAAFAVLFGITAAHVLLETARDALFLAKLPPSKLPLMYLAVAAVGLALTLAGRRRAKREGRVTSTLALSAVLTLGFWLMSDSESAAFLYALYLWSGSFAAVVVLQFWLLLGATYDVKQAKRLYGFIGAGSVLGALTGAAGARTLAASLAARQLLLGAAVLLVATALGPALFLPAPPPRPATRAAGGAPASGSIGTDLREVVGHPYVSRILLLVLLSTLTLTAADFVFKSAVATRVPAPELGAFFASVAVVLNGLALPVQLVGVGYVMRRVGVHGAVWILPVLLVGGAVGVALGGGLVAAMALKGVDGALRHSLHKTSTELLYIPIPDAQRGRAKPIIDLLGQRGGQAMASLAILGLIAVGRVDERALGVGVVALTIAWVVVAAGLRRHYIDIFRASVKQGRIDYLGDLPVLDLGALESLFTALNSQKDAEVIAALDLLAAQGKKRLIPALVLYHPSRVVVVRALELFTSEARNDFVPIAKRLLSHADVEVRAAALRAIAAVEPDEEFLRARLSDECLEVRATALVALVANGWLAGEEADEALAATTHDAAPAVRITLARAIAERPVARLEEVLLELISAAEPEVQLEAAWAMGKTKNARFVPVLVPLLKERLQGVGVRAALAEIGEPALAALDEAMSDPLVPEKVRWSIPRAISELPAELAVPVLEKHLAQHDDGLVRFRILRGLARLRSIEPGLELDRSLLVRVAEETARSAARLLAWRKTFEGAAERDPARDTAAGRLIATLLRDKETHALGRLFRLLGLLHPGESFERIQRGLHGKDVKVRAASAELVENLVEPGALRDAVMALIDDLPEKERLNRIPAAFRDEPIAADELLRAMISRGGDRGHLAAYHAREIGLEVSLADKEAADADFADTLVQERRVPVGAVASEMP